MLVQAIVTAPAFQDAVTAYLTNAPFPRSVPNADRILRLPEVLRRTGLKRSSLYVKIANGSFPRQLRLSPNMVGWRESEVMAWVAEPR
jgi:prophage regulatory protein